MRHNFQDPTVTRVIDAHSRKKIQTMSGMSARGEKLREVRTRDAFFFLDKKSKNRSESESGILSAFLV